MILTASTMVEEGRMEKGDEREKGKGRKELKDKRREKGGRRVLLWYSKLNM